MKSEMHNLIDKAKAAEARIGKGPLQSIQISTTGITTLIYQWGCHRLETLTELEAFCYPGEDKPTAPQTNP